MTNSVRLFRLLGSILVLCALAPSTAVAVPRLWASKTGVNVVRDDGMIWQWGGDDFNHFPPVRQFAPVGDCVPATVGWIGGFGIGTGGSLWGWGGGGNGIFGDGVTPGNTAPKIVSPDLGWRDVSGVGYLWLAVKDDGTLWASGYNEFGSLGNPALVQSATWTPIGTDRTWRDVSTTHNYTSYALAADGTLWGWGYEIGGSPSLVDSRTCWSSLQDNGIVIHDDGSYWSVGPGGASALPMSDQWKSIAVGEGFQLAIRKDGTLWAWGKNNCCQLGTGDSNDRWAPEQIGSKTDWVEISAGERHSVALDSAGDVWAWGVNWRGQLGATLPEFGRAPARVLTTGDFTPPTATTITSTSHPDESKWYSSRWVNFSVTGVDESWIRGYTWAVDSTGDLNGLCNGIGSSKTFMEDGVHTLSARIVDGGAQGGPIATRTVRIDCLPPEVVLTNAGPFYGTAVLDFDAADGTSGVITVDAVIDGKKYTITPGDTLPYRIPGTHSMAFSATDRAGNREATQTVSFTLYPSAVERVDGGDRFTVAANLARRGWDPDGTKSWRGVHDVVIANGENGKEADPLCAAGLAGACGAPVLLTGTTKLPASTKAVIAEIAKQNPFLRVHIIGGKSSVPDALWYEIRSIPGVQGTQDRLTGVDRYAVSAAVANRIVLLKGAAGVNGIILVAGDNPAAFYDALAVSPISYARTMPVLSVRKGSVPPSVATVLNSVALKNKPRYAASSAYFIAGSLSGASRLSTSSDRYTSACQIAQRARAENWTSATNTSLVAKLPDALTGGAYVGKLGGVMLFTDSSGSIRTASKSFIATNYMGIASGWVLGGTGSIPAAQETSFRSMLE